MTARFANGAAEMLFIGIEVALFHRIRKYKNENFNSKQ